MGVLNSLFAWGGEFVHQKNCPGGWSGLELTDTLDVLGEGKGVPQDSTCT